MSNNWINDIAVSNTLEDVANRWREAIYNTRYRTEFIITWILAFAVIWFNPHFFNAIQQRSGMLLNDPVLKMLPPTDLSNYIFFLIYGSTMVVLFYILMYPSLFVRGIQAFILLNFIRYISIYLVPLAEPAGLIYLQDPFLESAVYQNKVTKDLFFSGHVSTVFLFGVMVYNRYLKGFFYLSAMLIGGMILLQHAHYTIDVLAAPFFAWGVVKVTLKYGDWMEQKYPMLKTATVRDPH